MNFIKTVKQGCLFPLMLGISLETSLSNELNSLSAQEAIGEMKNGELYDLSSKSFSKTVLKEVDFENLITKWGQIRAEEKNNYCEWVDLYAKRIKKLCLPAILDRCKQYRINATCSDFKFTHPAQTFTDMQTSEVFYIGKRINNGTSPSHHEFSTSFETTSQYNWAFTKSLKLNLELTGKLTFPSIVELGGLAGGEITLTKTISSTKIQTKTITIKDQLTTNPGKQSDFKVVVNRKAIRTPFTVDINLQGFVAIKYKHKQQEHFIHFVPLKNIFYDLKKASKKDESLKELLKLYQITPEGVIFTAEGEFAAIYALECFMKIDEKTLKINVDKSISNVQGLNPSTVLVDENPNTDSEQDSSESKDCFESVLETSISDEEFQSLENSNEIHK